MSALVNLVCVVLFEQATYQMFCFVYCAEIVCVVFDGFTLLFLLLVIHKFHKYCRLITPNYLLTHLSVFLFFSFRPT